MNNKSTGKANGAESTDQYLDEVFRDLKLTHGLTSFRRGERGKLKMRRNEDGKIEICCAKRERWLRAKPEEIVRQLFLVWVLDTLKFPLKRILVEWPIQMGEDAEKERADIAIFSDDACTDPYIVFELKKPNSEEGLEQLRSYLRWTGCFFGCWSNGHSRGASEVRYREQPFPCRPGRTIEGWPRSD
jgi:hypothetical protein